VWEAVLSGTRDAIVLIEENVVQLAQDTRPMVVRAADAFLHKTQPKLGAEDRRLLATGWASFPEVAKVLVSIGSMDDVIDLPRTGDRLTHLRLVSHFDLKRMEQRYPELADFLDDFGDLVELKLQLRDANGNALADVWLDSGRMLARVEAYLQRRAGTEPRRQTAARHQARLPAHGGAHRCPCARGRHSHVRRRSAHRDGLCADRHAGHAGAPHAGLPCRRARARLVPRRHARLAHPPVTSRAWRRGRVSYSIAGSARATDSRRVDLQAGVEVLDTALIRFGMAIAADRVIPDEEQSADIRKLWVAYRDAFGRDLERFARYGKLP
jgi:hypothetical protein